MKRSIAAFCAIAFVVSACSQSTVISKDDGTAQLYETKVNPHFETILQAATPQDKDRAAVLAMQGEYSVDFDFKETVILGTEYERYPPKQAGAFETVLVLEERPDFISLQHILVVGDGHVVKHWRQDWTYEAKQRFEFVADQTWEVKTLDPKKSEGTWTQCVYEVSDAPRYCGTGKWNHRYGVSTWTSDRSWRPLPRREYTTRDDYNALNVENRHTVTPQGWTHEQDNTKVLRNGTDTQATLVREFGFNNYQSVKGYDFSPAYQYWQKTSDYWAQVRDSWKERFNRATQLTLNTEVDGMPIIVATFSHADALTKGSAVPSKSDIDDVLNKWVSITPK